MCDVMVWSLDEDTRARIRLSSPETKAVEKCVSLQQPEARKRRQWLKMVDMGEFALLAICCLVRVHLES